MDFCKNPYEWPQFLKEYGYRIIEDIDIKELKERYLNPTGRNLASTPIERIIFIERYNSNNYYLKTN